MRAFAVWFASGCAMGGALHQATLAGQCAEGDAACSQRHPQGPIAMGARFYPDIESSVDGAAPQLVVESADPTVLAVEGGALVGKRPGATAVLISTDDGAVVDFVHVWVAPVTAITLARRDGERIEGPISLTVGEDLAVVPTLWSGAQRLAGSADIVWTASADAPIAILRDGQAARRRLKARAPGHATFTVALGDATAAFDVEVVP